MMIAQKIQDAIRRILKPKPRLDLVQWSDTYRYLSGEASALPGRWRTERVPSAREVMEAVTDPTVTQITVMSCSQLMKTELLLNTIAFHASNDPCPMILMQPTVSMAEAFSKDRLAPMIRDTPILKELIAEKKSRDTDNTILHKAFPGGQLTLIGANAPSELASRPVRLILCDEVDRYPESVGREGDPISLIYERSATFFNRKLICASTPTIEGRSRIESLFLESDQRVHCGRCPHCGGLNEFKWEHVKWQKQDPTGTAAYMCPNCAVLWSEQERQQAIRTGAYQATAPFKGHAGFKVTKLSSPWEPLSALVKKFLESKDTPEKLKVFKNTQLAETWVEKGEAPDNQRLWERRESYSLNSIPQGVVFLTAGADVQKDRIEIEVVGWGRDKQSWSIDYRVISGDTSSEVPWKELDKILNETWINDREQQIQIQMLTIDSGYNTQKVYDFCRKYPSSRVRAIKGSEILQIIVGTPKDVDLSNTGTRLRRAVKLWSVGVSVLKSELYGWLKADKPEGNVYPLGYCHFPQYDLEHFKRLCAEQLMKRTINHRVIYRWEKLHERNEQLDCRLYARAAASMLGMDRFTESDWKLMRDRFETIPNFRRPISEKAEELFPPQKEKPSVFSQYPGFWDRQKGKAKY